jgi:hypothetical protein
MRRSSLLLLTAAMLALAVPSQAITPWQKVARDLGFTREGKKAVPGTSAPPADCTTCHQGEPGAADQGGRFKPMGQYLLDQKAKRKAEKIDIAWLKDYPPK